LLWSVKTKESFQRLRGRRNQDTTSVAWSPDARTIASGHTDGTIYLWDLKAGRQTQVLEGQIGGVSCVSFSSNGRFLFSLSQDGSIWLWRCHDQKIVAVLREPISQHEYSSLAVHPNPKATVLASLCEEGKSIYIWYLDLDVLLKTPSASSLIQYINAKAVLVGESGVGKSGLGIRMAEKKFRATDSTHGAQFWQIQVPEQVVQASNLNNVQAELTLWDLAGQPDYHLIHQLFLDDTDVALLLFDCSDVAEPFRGVPYWAKVLKKQAPSDALKYLVFSRCDVSSISVDQREINQVKHYSLEQTAANYHAGAVSGNPRVSVEA
jgi:small GTP-binding protein